MMTQLPLSPAQPTPGLIGRAASPTYVLERMRKGATAQQFLAALRAHYPADTTFFVSAAMAAELGPADDLATHRYAQDDEALVEKTR